MRFISSRSETFLASRCDSLREYFSIRTDCNRRRERSERRCWSAGAYIMKHYINTNKTTRRFKILKYLLQKLVEKIELLIGYSVQLFLHDVRAVCLQLLEEWGQRCLRCVVEEERFGAQRVGYCSSQLARFRRRWRGRILTGEAAVGSDGFAVVSLK